jgi:hypothetical protein
MWSSDIWTQASRAGVKDRNSNREVASNLRSGTGSEELMKRFGIAIAGIALAAMVSGSALAQGRGGGGGGMGGGGGWHGGGSSGGSMGGGGGWHGGGSSGWNGGGSGWHGGSWNGGSWRGGYWRGGYYPYRYYYPGVGFYFGLGWPYYWGGYPYYYPYYSASYPVSYPYAAADAGVEGVYSQAAPATPQAVPANQYWYYCTDPAGYYPYVQNCSKAWMQVVPQADPGAPRLAPPQSQ